MDLRHIKQIKEGGFGVVEEVCDSKGKIYAKKTFSLNQSAKYSKATIENERKRFIQEAHFLHSFRHKNTVPVLDYNSKADPPYFIMPKAIQSFSTDLKEHPKHIKKYFHAFMDILSGLEEIHSMGICHLDLKPSNVLRFKGQDASDFYAIGDFGCMINPNSLFPDLDKHKTKMNPNNYSAPEIVKDLSKGTIQSDIYSLGCILHDLMGIKDRKPCKQIFDKVNFGSIILKCSRKDPSLRFGSVEELRDALISLNDVPIETSSPDGAKCIKILNYKKRLSKNQWIKIIKFVSDELYSPDGPLVLRKITLDRIQEVVKHYPRQASKLGITVAQWTRDADFEFAECDGLSNRLEIFIKNCNVQVQKECLAAMLYMGSRHNRWYVERKFVQLVGKNIKLALARSLVAEFKGNRQDACEAIKHLKKSSLLNIDNLHPLLAQAFVEIS